MFHFLGEPALDLKTCGRKAGQLHQLLSQGFEVPRGFVVPPACELARVSIGELEAAVAKLGGFPVAARSSGALEDLEGASFAGQYTTFLEVADAATLLEKIRLCRESARSPQVRAYLKSKGLPEEGAPMTVLVQRMVDARAAGVAFSIHPLTGNEDHGLLEACRGLGERLVSGHTTPSQFVLRLRDGAVLDSKPGDENVDLGDGAFRELAANLLRIQAFFGLPQDVEWAIDQGGKLWILQARPVTKIQWRSDVEEFTNADFKDGGVSARVCTPMMYSLYREAMSVSMPKYFVDIKLATRGEAFAETWIDSFYGRPYWNASAVKRRLFRVPGFSERAFDEDLGIQKSYGPKGPVVVPTNVKTIAGAIPVALALEKEYQGQMKRTDGFGAAFLPAEARWLARIEAFPRMQDSDFFADLSRVYGEFYRNTECSYFTTIYNNANAQSDFKSFLRKMDEAVGGETSIVRLIGGLADVSHMKMQRGFLQLYRIARSEGFGSPTWTEGLAAFLKENYFHGDAELELMTPRWGEAPARVEEIVRGMVASGTEPADPERTVASQRREFESEVATVNARIGGGFVSRMRFAGGFRKHLERVRGYLSRREEMREYSTRAYYVVRLYVLEAGRRLARAGKLPNGDAIFMLHLPEALKLAEGKWTQTEADELILYRTRLFHGYRDLVPPNELGKGVSQRGEESFVESADGRTVLKGLGCSSGVVEGVARVVRSLEETGELRKGEILVTRFTDPGWTPVLGLVAGVVTEVGGLLSHAAVIGREYGIPAVLNLPGATKALRSGQKIRMNGSTGVVEILD